jgi:surfactin synthase thioesterase subunit
VPEQAAATPADAARYLASVDPGALADAPSDDWREVVAATAAHDLRLLRQFVTASSDTASFGIASSVSLRCPVLAVRGDADPLTSDDGIGEWKHYTDGAFSWLVFPGGHSDVLRSPACTSLIREIRNGWP